LSSVPIVSVVIPTHNRVDRWPALLDALSKQSFSFEDFEVVVVSDGSTDATDDFVPAVATPFRLRFEAQTNGGPAVARNRGVELARADLILFLDDDIVPANTLIERHVRRHRTEDSSIALIGPMISPPGVALSAPVRWEQAMLSKQYTAMARGDYRPSYRQFFTANASVARDAIVSAGGFDARFRRAEDVEFAYRLDRAGVRFRFDPAAIGYHHAERSFTAWLSNAHAYGVNDVVFARDHESEGVFERTGRELRARQALVRGATRACVARPQFERMAAGTLRAVATTTDRLHADKLTQFALSGLYNLSYYCGMAGELGGAQEFYDAIAPSRATSRASSLVGAAARGRT
jgi:GT2 family glycosyltransferase